MAREKITEVLTENLKEHEAVRAWNQVQSNYAEPVSIEVLKYNRKCAVYRLNGIESGGATVIAKRCRSAAAGIQRMIYEEFLPLVSLPALRCYGFLEEKEGEFCWLFLQDAAGVPYSSEIAEHRALAGGWLGRMHVAPTFSKLKACLPARGLDHYLKLLRRCSATLLDHLTNNTDVSGQDASLLRSVVWHCDVLESHWGELEQICGVIPPALIHGDFAAKNVRVQTALDGAALMVFDWEHSGWGPPVMDLAQYASRVISPDLFAYCSVMKRDYPDLELRDVKRAAECGNLVRMVSEIDWANALLRFGSPRFLPKPFATLRIYEPRLEAVLRALNWS
jgi:hypothetical protein